MPPTDFVTRGQALIAAGQYQEAVRVCRLGLLGKPTELDGRLILGQALLALRRYDEVLAEMRIALELDGRVAAAHALKGEALLRKGDLHAARDALMRARQAAPGDPSVAALVAETELALSTGGGLAPGAPGEAQTKHYPSHRGGGRAPGPGPSSSSFTRPEVTTPDGPTRVGGPPGARARGGPLHDRTGTVEIDPEELGVELVEDDDLGEVIDPPGVGDDTAGLDTSDLVEVDETDVVEDEPSHAGVVAAPAPLADSEATVAGRPQARGATRGPRVASAGPDLGALFPDDGRDDESGLDALLGELGGPPAGDRGGPLRAPPTGSTPFVDPPAPAPAPRGRPSDDMRMIRAGLGLDPDQRLPPRADAAGAPSGRPDESTGIVVTAAACRAGRGDDTSAILDSDRRDPPHVDPKRKERTRKVQTEPGARSVVRARPRRSRLAIALWALLAGGVIGGGVYGGFQIRELRLERQVAAARREAAAAAQDDTWRGWRAARDVLEGVVRAQDNARNRAALARAQAVLAAEFGDGVDAARAAVAALDGSAEPDAAVARAYLALADADPAAATAAAAALEEAGVAEAEAAYLAGRAALLAERWDDAVAAFDRARGGEARPVYLIGLARAHAGRRAWPEARAAIELALSRQADHPAAVIERARIFAAGGPTATAGVDLGAAVAALERVLAEAERPVDDQAQGVSPAQAAWAALALAELEVSRGDPAAARRALARARAGEPADRAFAVAVVDVLVDVGDLAAARQAADAAASAWPDAAAVRIAVADVALAQGDPAAALAALEQAGDLDGRPEALALRGQARLAQGETDGARADLDAALAAAPGLEPALVARAELDLADGNPRAAVGRLERHYTQGASPALAVTYAAALRGVGETERARQALAALTDGAAVGALAGRAWLETARLERDAGDARKARNAYAKAIELLPDPTGARLEAALLLVDAGDATGARESLDRLVNDTSGDGRVLVEAARVHVLTGDLEGARGLLDRAETAPSAPRWQIARERGRLALRERKIPVAIEALERAAGLEPSDGETRLLLIDAHLAKQDGAAARRVLEDVLKRFAGLPEAQLAQGRVRLFADATDEAREAFVKAKDQLERAKAAPRWIADATYWLGVTHYYSGDAGKARPLLAQAVALDPTHADAYALLGDVDAERKDWKAATKAFQKATQLDPENVERWFDLGAAAAKARQKKTARAALQTYLKKAPEGELVEDARALLRKL